MNTSRKREEEATNQRRLISRLGLGLRIDVLSVFRFETEDRELIKGALMGKLSKVRLNRP